MIDASPATQARPPSSLAPRRWLTIENEDWSAPDGQTGSLAKLVVPDNGGAIRGTITGLSKHSTGIYPSAKTRRTQYLEGCAERALAYQAEVYPDIVDWQTQPFRLEFTMDGKRQAYIADQARLYADGHVEVIEAKSTERGFSDLDYRRKLDRAEEIFDRIGWRFRRVIRSKIFRSEVEARNVGLVQSRGFVAVKPSHLEALALIREAGDFAVAYGDLATRLEPDQPLFGEAVAQALMVRREIHIDVARHLTPDTPVWILSSPTQIANPARF